jgi:hypothetical protein
VSSPDERLAAVLGRHYAEDRIDAQQLDERLTLVYQGAPPEEILAGLPPLADPSPPRRRRRRHGEAATAEPTWIPTQERFIDPSTRRRMRVWVDPADHRRHYVPHA